MAGEDASWKLVLHERCGVQGRDQDRIDECFEVAVIDLQRVKPSQQDHGTSHFLEGKRVYAFGKLSTADCGLDDGAGEPSTCRANGSFDLLAQLWVFKTSLE